MSESIIRYEAGHCVHWGGVYWRADDGGDRQDEPGQEGVGGGHQRGADCGVELGQPAGL